MAVIRRRRPPRSAFLKDFDQSYYSDSYEAPLRHGDLSITAIYLALFAHHPRWARWLLILRGWIVRPLGLRTTTSAAFDIRFRRGLLTASDRHLARYLKYVEEFPCFLPALR